MSDERRVNTVTEVITFFEGGFNDGDDDGDDTPISIVNGSRDNSIVSKVSSHFPFNRNL